MYDKFASRYKYTLAEFVELTPKLFYHLNRAIDRAEAAEYYLKLSMQYSASGQQIKVSLEEYLALVFNEGMEEKTTFDDTTAAALEKHALQELEKMKNV